MVQRTGLLIQVNDVIMGGLFLWFREQASLFKSMMS
jgi:hypothetical protein